MLGRTGPPGTITAMSICIQDSEAEIPELARATCERLLGVQVKRDDGRLVPSVFWLKIQGGRWHRFFIDAWILQWRERDEIDEADLSFDSEAPVLDVAAKYQLAGRPISRIQMRQTPDDPEFDSRLIISFADGVTLMLQCSEDDSRLSVADCEGA